MFEEVPAEAHGTPVNEVGATLYRPKFTTTGDALGVRVWGAHVDGPNWRSEVGFALRGREQLRELIDQLQGIYYGWPGDYR